MIPPRAKMTPMMLAIILGVAISGAIMIPRQVEVAERKAEVEEQKTAEEHKAAFRRGGQQAFYATSCIPSGSTILEKQIEPRRIKDSELWDDAALKTSQIVGHTALNAIPENAQIRQSDLYVER